MNVAGVGSVLGGATWLEPDTIETVTFPMGEMPVTWTDGDTVFVVPVFAGLADGRYEQWAIYLRVQGELIANCSLRRCAENGSLRER